MKKIIFLLLTSILLLNLTGCGIGRAEVPEFTAHTGDFTSIAIFARTYYDNKKDECDGKICMSLAKNEEVGYKLIDLTLDNEFSNSPDELSNSLEKVYKSGFRDITVTDGYLIFWEDETHKYGLLCAESPDNAREDYSLRRNQIRKIEGDWYEIDRGGI